MLGLQRILVGMLCFLFGLVVLGTFQVLGRQPTCTAEAVDGPHSTSLTAASIHHPVRPR